MSNPTGTVRSLHREWLATVLLYIVGLSAGCWALSAWWNPGLARLWLIPACLVGALILVELWRNLLLNHRRSDAVLLPTMGAGTALTLTRALLLAFLAGFLPLPRPPGWLSWAPAACYLSAALIDYADGYVARVTDHATPLGEQLDLDLDALGILVAPLLGVLYGTLPVWYLLVSAARYVFAAGIWWLKRRGRSVYNLTQSARRRGMAGFQMGLSAVALLPIIGRPGMIIVASLFMIPFLAGFVRDWLVVSGALDPRSSGYQAAMQRSEKVFYGWLPVLLRAAAGVLTIYFVLAEAPASTGKSTLPMVVVFQIGLAVLIIAGVLGRLAALVSMVSSGLLISSASLEPLGIVVLIALTLVVLFGTGYFSVWQPEESFLRYHAGSAT